MTFIKSVEKAIDILSCFSIDNPVLSTGEIHRMTGLNQSTVSHIIATLVLKKCIERIETSGQYRLGVKFHQWFSILRQKTKLSDVARPIMESLRDFCGEEVSLYVFNDGSRICIEAVASRHGLAKVTPVGKILPLHCGAAGKVLLAYISDKERKNILGKKSLKMFTPYTITDISVLERDLALIHQKGYAISLGEREEGTYSVVAPVLDGGGKIVASLSISGPTFRLSEERKKANIKAVLKGAAEIANFLVSGDEVVMA